MAPAALRRVSIQCRLGRCLKAVPKTAADFPDDRSPATPHSLTLASQAASFGDSSRRSFPKKGRRPRLRDKSRSPICESRRIIHDNREPARPAGIERAGALVPVFRTPLSPQRGRRCSAGAYCSLWRFHSAADEWTGDLRRLLKEKFGDGGSGFSLAGRPFAGYHRLDVQEGGSAGWRSEGLRSGAGDGFFGLGGISSSTRAAGQSVFIKTNCDRLEIDYLRQPDGGDLALYDRDELVQKFSTSGEIRRRNLYVSAGKKGRTTLY